MTDEHPANANHERAPRGLRGFAESVGLIPPQAGKDPYAHRRGEPRGFTVVWLVFLLVAAGVVYSTVGNPVLASAEGYRFASKVLLTTVAVGMLTIWPVLRLAQRAPLAGGVAAALRDVAIVLIPMQALIWPQTLITGWTVGAVAAIATLFTAWTLIVGAVIALATGVPRVPARSLAALRGSPEPVNPVVRSMAMLAILSLALAAPGAMLLLGPSATEASGQVDQMALWSPITGPWEILADRAWTGRHAVALPEHWRPILLTLVGSLAAWGVLLATRRAPRSLPATTPGVEDDTGSA